MVGVGEDISEMGVGIEVAWVGAGVTGVGVEIVGVGGAASICVTAISAMTGK